MAKGKRSKVAGGIRVDPLLDPSWSKDMPLHLFDTKEQVTSKAIESSSMAKDVLETPIETPTITDLSLSDKRGIDYVPTMEGQQFMKENLHLSYEKVLDHLWNNNLIEFGHNVKAETKPVLTWMQNTFKKMGLDKVKEGQSQQLRKLGWHEKKSTVNKQENIDIVQDLFNRRPEIVEELASSTGGRWQKSAQAIVEGALKEEGIALVDRTNNPYSAHSFNHHILANTSVGSLKELRGQQEMTKNHDLLILEALDKSIIDPKGTGYGIKAKLQEFIKNDPALVARAEELGVSDILNMSKDKITQRANKIWKGRAAIMKNPDPINQALVNRILEAGSGAKKTRVKWEDIPEGSELTNSKYYLDKWNNELYNQEISYTPQYAGNIIKVIRKVLDKNAELEMADAFLPEMQNTTVKNFWDGLITRKKEYNSNVFKRPDKSDPLIDVIIDEHIQPVWAGGDFGLNNRQFIFSGAHGGSAIAGSRKTAAGIMEGGGPKKGLRQKGYIDVLLYKLNQKIQNAAVEGNWDVVNSAVNNKGKIMDYVNSVGLYKVDMAVEPGKLYKMDNKPTWRSNVTRENFRSDADYARYQDAINKNSVSKDRHSGLNDLQRLEREFDLLSETTGKEVLEKADFEEGGLVPPQPIQSSLVSVEEVLNGI